MAEIKVLFFLLKIYWLRTEMYSSWFPKIDFAAGASQRANPHIPAVYLCMIQLHNLNARSTLNF